MKRLTPNHLKNLKKILESRSFITDDLQPDTLSAAYDSFGLSPELKDAFILPARNRVIYGGRASSKTYQAAGVAIAMARIRTVRILCTRQFQARIADSVYTILVSTIRRYELQGEFEITNNKIRHKKTGSEFIFYGLARNIEEIRGLESVDICWLEEAHLMTKTQWDILEPTLIRNADYEFWIIFNPRLSTDFVYRHFVIDPPPDSIVRKINYLENPYLNPQALAVINRMKEVAPDDYDHFYLGNPQSENDLAIIKQAWIRAAVDAHLIITDIASGSKRIGFDVADSGEDSNALASVHGSMVYDLEKWQGKEHELLGSFGRTYRKAKDTDSEIIYDSCGIGAGAGSKIRELNNENRQTGDNKPVRFRAWNAGGSVYRPDAKYNEHVTNRDMFANAKAQNWFAMADRFRKTYQAVKMGMSYNPDELISIKSDLPFLEQLIVELSTPLRDIDGAGRVKVESKKDLQKRGIPSPNLADSVVLSFAIGQPEMRINEYV